MDFRIDNVGSMLEMEFRIDLDGVRDALEAYRRAVREEQERLDAQPPFLQQWAAARANWEKMRSWMLHCGGKAQWKGRWNGTKRRRLYMPSIPEDKEYFEGDEKQVRQRRRKVRTPWHRSGDA